MAEQHIIIRFKPDLPARTQKGFVFFQLAGMGQPLFKMSWTGPGIAEINKNSLHRILTGQNLINALDIISHKAHVIRYLPRLRKQRVDLAAANAQHVAANIYRQQIFFRVGQREPRGKASLSAAQLQIQRLRPYKRLLPLLF